MAEVTAAKLITPTALLSYPWLDKPQPLAKDAKPGTKEKYSATLIFPAGTDINALRKAALAVAEAKWPGKVQEMIEASKKSIAAGGPMTFRLPFRSDAKPGYPDGCTFINCRGNTAPGLVYAHAAPGKTTPEPVPADKVKEVFYPGAKVRGSVTAFAYDNSGNKGISFGLNNLQKVAEGERMDSRVAAEDEFTADLSAAPADLASLIG